MLFKRKKVTKQKTIKRMDVSDFNTAVQSLLDKGWSPKGDVIVFQGSDKYTYYVQTLVRYD